MDFEQNVRRRGFSMVEIVVATLLVGIVVVGSLSTLGAAVRTQTTSSKLADGPLLAEQLLAEIMSMPFEDPEDGGSSLGLNSGESGGNRLDFDDVDDFHGWSPSNVQTRDGTVLSEYAGWTRAAVVQWANRFSGDWRSTESSLKRIFVTVVSPDGVITQRFALRSQHGALEQAPILDKNVVTQLEGTLVIGAGGAQVSKTSNLLNHVEDPNAN
ncbi:MAG: prepilin-type N-terminal cleavage/methylation domain-containing protein [Pirellulales bacterium]|nr:prepilin-type N-terminal cleavage/methylation domain-containing protein [Pirellulales bacterium]